jgi:hypothetical protein
MKRKTHKTRFSAWGYFWMFVSVTLVASSSILLYSAVSERSGGNRALSAGLSLLNIFLLTTVYVAIDAVRRKLTVERPVEKILEATERITKGDFSVRVQPSHAWSRYDEYDMIMDNLNRMTEELEKNELLKTDFISNVSHEIKTPLSVIQNYASMLKEEPSSEKRKEYADTLSTAAKRLAALTSNVLKLSKLENQTITPQKTEIRLDESLTECILQFEEEIDKKGLRLDCDIREITAVSDESCLELVWNNLISNAVKFTDEGGKIEISLKEEGGAVVFVISDTGCGMSSETGVHIFDKFYQGDTSHSREGNGLGLALVKKVIDILGGEIGVSSELGKGSTFTVKLRKDAR